MQLDLNDKAGFACYFWVNWAYYDLTKLTKVESDYSSETANWNFCKYANIPSNSYNVTQTFAYMTDNSGPMLSYLPMTDNDLTFNHVTHESDSNNVTFTQDSDIQCPQGDDNETTSFTATIVCDKEITEVGQG